MQKFTTRWSLIMVLLLLVTACGGPEAKKAKFFNKGKTLYDKGDFVKARLEFKNAVQIDPKFADAYRMLGLLELKDGNFKNAYGDFLKVVELNPADLEAQYQLGKLFLGGGTPDKAMEKADLILKRDGNNIDGILLKGAVYVAKKEFDTAIPYLEGIISKGNTKPDAYQLLASAFLQKNDLKNAESVLTKGVAANPKSVGTLYPLAELKARGGRTDEAAALIRQIISLEPNEPRHVITLAGLYWNTDQKRAVETLKGLVAAAPQDQDRRLQAAGFYISRNRPDDAERELKDGIASIAKNFKLRFALSELYANTNKPDQAINTLKEALTKGNDLEKPDLVQAKTTLAKIYLIRHDLATASQYADDVIKESPKNSEAHFTKGNIFLLKRDGANAVSEFRTVVNDAPQYAQAQIRLAEAHLLNKEPSLAADVLKTALKADPTSRDLSIGLARVLIVQKDYKQSEELLNKILVKNPADLEVISELGDIFMRAGDLKRAESQYSELKRKAPQLPIGYVKFSELYVKQGRADKAESELEQAYRRNPQAWRVANDLAYLLSENARSASELDRALSLARKALAQNPSEHAVEDTLGWIYYKKGDFKQALEFLGKVQDAAPGNPLINFHVGMAQYKAGNRDKARESLKKSLAGNETFPGREEAEKTLKVL
jgi:tetratricopeptide (TPR) repeat protein